ncbi:hypothetical protein MAM1_0396c10293 [Mucor ambiguus]|uniref:PAS domain-containing protein n=1 Tax=Mucor ambiguus TaxID=91626 RepID=A0A0C9MIR7_9FUNG|nr:hypothetical protein MAM1_0396c10293 [Mucor ambiguus]
MQHTTCHSFHACPLRSSSLLIVSKEKQTIVTATDEIFNMLGYEPTRLIGKSIDILHPRSAPNKSSSSCYTLRHAFCGDIPFDICSHFDPLANATDLEYWLIRPVQHMTTIPNIHTSNNTMRGPVTILRLSPFGTIEHAYPSSEFPQKPHELRGHPIMSFVYKSDVRFLCERLSKLPKRTFATFKVRWLKQHPRHNMEDQFEWVAFTVMNSPRRLSCSAVDDPQTRPTCIIRPIYDPIDTEEKEEEVDLYYTLWDTLPLPVKSCISTIFSTLDTLHAAMDEGRSYVVQYVKHLITHFLKVSSELLYYAALEFQQYPNYNHEDSSENSSKKEELFVSGSSACDTNTIKVTLDNCIWSVPLLINNSLHKSNHPNMPFTKPIKSKHKYHYH